MCLRGEPGWGENMALLSTMANSFGGRWFNMDWRPQFDTAPWTKAINFYVDLLGRYGPPSAPTDGYTENLSLFRKGHCAMWVDATVAAGNVTDPSASKVHDRVGFAQAPYQTTRKGSHWLWSWSLAVPSSSPDKAAATRFVAWATSRRYTRLVARKRAGRRRRRVPGSRSTRTPTIRRRHHSQSVSCRRFRRPTPTIAAPGLRRTWGSR
ncbi:MAG TPA: extracellular solute-binding protein [Gammaproteobacteria bacterium]|nr:extracellular solute-binding protein [Gammaproteobacteria bacterium]